MRINTNIPSLNIYKNYVKELSKQNTTMARISSGLKVVSSKDDPIALASSEKIRMQIKSSQVISRNVQDGISLLQVGEGGISGITDSLQKIRELVVSNDDTKTPEDKVIIQSQIDELIHGIDGLANDTEMNGVKVLGSSETLNVVSGLNGGETIDIQLKNMDSNNIGKSSDSGKALKELLGSNEGIASLGDEALDIVDGAIKDVTAYNNKFGALEKRFESCYNDISAFTDTLEKSDSQLRDADIGEEMANFSTESILTQASTALLVQTNKFPQDVLRILENVRHR